MRAWLAQPRVQLALGAGVCGGFTTFSTFSVDMMQMMAVGAGSRALALAMVSNIGGIGAAWIGLRVVSRALR